MQTRWCVTVVAVVIATLSVGLTSVAATLVINEVAWAGTAASSADEWIELANVSDKLIGLTGWTLVFGDTVIHLGTLDGATKEIRQTTVESGDFFLLERTDDSTISDVEADLIYTGNLVNAGMVLRLFDADGVEADTANVGQEGWTAGNDSADEPPFATMERVDPAGPDVPENWRSNDGVIRSGCDANGETLSGTPAEKNSATIVAETVPVVEILSPLEGEEVHERVTISWTAINPDGRPEELRIDIFLSSDGGTSWEALVEGLANSGAYTWDATSFPDGQAYRLKVVASDSDGHFGEGESPVFAVVSEL